MSHSSDSQHLTAERLDSGIAQKYSTWSAAACLIGLLISGIGFVSNKQQFAFSWLFGCMFVLTLCMGGLFWTILHSATDSEWGVLVRRQMENIASVIPYMSVFFLPLLFFCAPILWKWWEVAPGEDPLLDAKSGFLNHQFFYIRFAAYFLGLGGVALALRKASVAQDEDGAARHTYFLRKAAIAGLPIFAVCLTFASVDWLMGLDYHWFSTMWGVYIFAGSAGSSMALLVLVITALRKAGYLRAVNEEHYHIMGKFMLAFTVFWAYIAYSQYMLIWYANMPEESIYFKIRNTAGWHTLTSILVVGRFFIPFPLLLFQGSKKNVRILCAIAGWMIAMQLLDHYIIVLPALHTSGVSVSPYDIGSLLAVGGAAAHLFIRRISSANLFPTRDPRLVGSVTLSN
jgi:hypothetical protein